MNSPTISAWPQQRMNLIYAGNPLCSWSYGFGKELAALLPLHPELRLHIVAGGLRLDPREVLDRHGKQFHMRHWDRVQANTGLPFDRAAFLARERFVHDSEPASRAFVAARRLAPRADLLAVFRRLQHAFYAEGRDITRGAELAGAAAGELQVQGFGIGTRTFEAEWRSEDAVLETRADMRLARMLGADSFPSLLLDTGRGIVPISQGYADTALLDMRLRGIMAAMPRAA